LSVGQVVAVTLGFLIASALVFVFGMWVGKDIAERRLAQEERVIRAPVARTTPAEAETRDPDITISEQLRQGSPAPPMAVAAAPLPPTPTPVPERTRTPVTIAIPTRTRVALAPRPTPIPHVAPPPAETHEEWADAGWTVQVSATTDPSNAASIAAKLRSKGIEAYTVRAPMRGETWYRVRVGHFASRERAQDMEQRLRSEGYPNAYVTAR
jgi:DedD protein